MSVLTGQREELRRILFEGTPHWIKPDGDTLRIADGRTVRDADATYLPPCDPTKIICIHLNYESRRVEFHAPPLTTPTYFQKPTTALNSHRGKLNRPANCQYLNYEGEIAVIVGKPMRNVAPKEVWDYLAGFAPANDVGAQDFRDTDAGSMLRVKGQDGFCPIGPGIVRGVDIRESRVRTYINGKVVQDGPVSEMTFDIPYIMADLSRHITLLPGDVVLSGTPANSRPMQPGDVVEIEVTGIGRLSNTVQSVPAPAHDVGHQPTDSEQVRRVALDSFRRVVQAKQLAPEFGWKPVISIALSESRDGVAEYRFELDVAGDKVPGVIWSPEGRPGERPLILMGHGRAQHKKTGLITRLATRFAQNLGHATLAIDAPDHGDRISREEAARIAEQVGERVRSAGRASEPTAEMVRSMAERARRAVPEWRAALDIALSLDCIGNTSRVGYWGLSMATSIGVPLVASETRIKCAVFGLSGLRPGAEELEAAARAIAVPVQFAFQWDDAIALRATGLALFEAFGSAEKTMHINMGGHVEIPDFERDAWQEFFVRHLGTATFP